VIFATVGTTAFPFARLVDAVAALPGEVVVQHGPVPAPATVARAHAFLNLPEFLRYVEEADKVVCHAGDGSILAAVRAGHVPVVLPRLARYGEAVDDHQLELAAHLSLARHVIAVADPADLPEAVAGAPSRAAPRHHPRGRLQAAIRGALQGA
jgi:UDP-N-acetylglucosamine transferase subunit ALG13